ncbi:hypothetical protein RB594_003702 [Gaeumannomyces avenae]
MHDFKKPKKDLSRFKLDIPLMGKGKKKSNQKEKKAAEFLLTRRGEASEVANCSPDSGAGVVIELCRDCFQAKKSYQLALDAFITNDIKRGNAATAPPPSFPASAPAPELDVTTEISFKELEENIGQMGEDSTFAIGKL